MPFQKGNKEGEKKRVFEDALRRAMSKDDWKALNRGCQKLAEEAEKGERWALEIVRDTLDGKPKQTIEADYTLHTAVDVTGSDELAGKVAPHLERRTRPAGDTVQ